MKKSGCGILARTAALLTVLLLWSGTVQEISALPNSVAISISASIRLEGSQPEEPDVFQVKLVPSDGTAPMPENGKDVLTIRGENLGTFPEIRYTRQGIYRYTIYQIAGTASCTYDGAEYYLTVTVAEEDNGLECAAVLYQDNQNNKLELPVFCNRYPEEPQTEKPADPSDTADPSGNSRNPSSAKSGLVPTGVQDLWPLYAAGIAVLLIISGCMVRVLVRKEDGDDPSEK